MLRSEMSHQIGDVDSDSARQRGKLLPTSLAWGQGVIAIIIDFLFSTFYLFFF